MPFSRTSCGSRGLSKPKRKVALMQAHSLCFANVSVKFCLSLAELASSVGETRQTHVHFSVERGKVPVNRYDLGYRTTIANRQPQMTGR